MNFKSAVIKEIKKDKLALISLVFLIGFIIFILIGSIIVNNDKTNKVSIRNINKPPSQTFMLGTDPNGRDMVGQIIIGARNSFAIAVGVTIITTIVGIFLGLVAGFYGGAIDNIIMRITDFFSMLPTIMLIIVFVTLVPKYNVVTLIFIYSTFIWMSITRIIRAKTLQQSSLDYVAASKTLGTPNIIIMFREVLPNIVSIIVVESILGLAGNMGIETGLSFLGFGLPFKTPSLGTLLSYARTPENLQNRSWQWLPAAIVIFIIMISINFIGQAIKRAADSKQHTS